MRPKIFLLGDIGCGKSSLIRSCLGGDAARAGGFVTLRRGLEKEPTGFDLAPARALVDENVARQTFLDFTKQPKREDSVFSGFGVNLLKEAETYPFAVADEFGGLELEIPEFRQALLEFLSLDIPCIGVLKNEEASAALTRRTGLGGDYAKAYAALRKFLEQDSRTQLLPVTGWADKSAQSYLENWANRYIRK